MFDLKAYLEERSRLVNNELAARLPAEDERPCRLHQAMRYAVLAGGKRIRPILCMAAGECAGAPPEKTLAPALAIEILHTYTLVHDDLPCMDDDDLRRGKPTLHKAFGEAEAVLAGDALLTLAFEWLAGVQAPPPYPPNRLSLELARASGSMGVIGGQFEDIGATGRVSHRDSSRCASAPLREMSPHAQKALLSYIQSHKTGALITAAVRMGAIAGGADEKELAALTEYGGRLGAAFQAVDDILNATSTPEQLGKSVGTDKAHDKLTCVSVYGLAKARTMAEKHRDAAIAALSGLPATEPLVAIAQYVVSRAS